VTNNRGGLTSEDTMGNWSPYEGSAWPYSSGWIDHQPTTLYRHGLLYI